LANVWYYEGRFSEALECLEDVVAIRRRTGREHEPDMMNALESLSALMEAVGRWDEAESLEREVIALHREFYGEERAFRLAMYQHRLGRYLFAQRKFDEAEQLIAESYEFLTRVGGERHPAALSALLTQGKLFLETGRLDEAARAFERVARLRSEVLGEDHDEVLLAQLHLGSVLLAQGSPEEARALHERVLEVALRRPDNQFSNLAKSFLAEDLVQCGEPHQAELLWREATEVERGRFGANAERTMSVESRVANVLRLQGKLAEAESLFLDLVERCDATFGPGDWRRPGFVAGVGACRLEQGCYESAASLLSSAYSGYCTYVGPANKMTQECLGMLVRAYERCNDAEKAAEFRSKLVAAQ
jgi:tetratricopeptide (TPR) repeat protein